MMRKRTHEILEVAGPGDLPSRICDFLIFSLILLNTIAFIAETVEPWKARWQTGFAWFELVSVIIFTIEYLLRLWSSVENAEYSHPFFGRLKFALSPLAITDLLAFLPFYLTFTVIDLRFLRMLRLFRIARVAKLGRYSTALQTLWRVLNRKKAELAVSVSFMIVLLIIASSLMYFAEHDAQPEKFSSIPESMWWSIATLTTVGYGDVYPITGLGKFLASLVAVFGIAMFALPTGILGAAFVEELQTRNESRLICPHCGKETQL